MKKNRITGFVVIVLIVSFGITSLFPHSNDSPRDSKNVKNVELSGPPESGDWIIDNETTIVGENFDINGRILIMECGHLTLDSCIVRMHSTIDWYPHDQVNHFEVYDGANLTIIDSHILSATSYRWYIQADGGSGVEIRGCDLEGNFPIPDPTFMRGSMINLGGWPTYEPLLYAIVVDNHIHDYEGSGVFLHSENAIMTDNVLDNLYGYAIDLYYSQNALVTHNTIDNIGTDILLNTGDPQSGTGILLETCEWANVSFNTMTNVQTRGFGWRVNTWSPLLEPIGGLSDFEGNTVDGEDVLFIQSTDSEIVGSGYSEVIAHNCTNLTIEDYSGVSLAVSFCDGLTLRNSFVKWSPLEIVYCNDVEIYNNTVNNTLFGDALFIGRGSGVQVYNNTVMNGYEWSWGLHARWSNDVEIFDNLVMNQGRWGICVMDSENVRVFENTVIDSGASGIVVWRTPNAEISFNHVDRISGKGRSFSEGLYAGYVGINIRDCDNTLIESNTVTNAISDGIWVDSSDDVVIEGNIITDLPGRGLFLVTCLRSTLTNNYVRNATWVGIGFYECNNLTVSDIVLEDIEGTPILWHNKYIKHRFTEFVNVSHNGLPIFLFQDQEGVSIESDISSAILINCSNTIVDGFEGDTIAFAHSSNCMLRNSIINGGGTGFTYSPNATIANSKFLDMPKVNITFSWGFMWWGLTGISLYSCDDSLVINNLVNNSGLSGISIFHCVPSRIIGNRIENSGEDGIYLWNTREDTVTSNFVNNSYDYSLYIDSTGRCDIYLNEFGYSRQGSVFLDGATLIQWHNGTHGNYWIDYNGTDGNSDGIGDIPYVIDEENSDLYPLVGAEYIVQHETDLLSIGPNITGVVFSPNQPMTLDNVTVNATATSTYQIAYLILSYSIDGGTTWVNVTMVSLDGLWTTTLTSLPEGVIQWKLYAIDSIGNYHILELENLNVASTVNVLVIGVAGVGIIAVLAIVFILKKRSS